MPTVEGNVKGAALVMRLNSVARLFVGTGDKLLEQSHGEWVDRSRASGYLSGGENRWRFAQFGNATLATNQMDMIQHSTEGAFELSKPNAPEIFSVIPKGDRTMQKKKGSP